MSDNSPDEPEAVPPADPNVLPSRYDGLKLLRKILIYHLALIGTVMALVVINPDFINYLPVGGVTELEESGELSVSGLTEYDDYEVEDDEIVSSIIKATNDFDRLGYARELLVVLVGVWLLALPVSWVHKGMHDASSHDHSLDETTLILPGVVATIVMVVQHSLALAFSLAGIVAGVQFRRALQDTFDALFILVAIGTGLSAGIGALEITTVLTVFFCYATLYVYYMGDGLETHHEAQRKAVKEQRKAAAKAAEI